MSSKYGNKRTEVDGYKFDSLAEARRYQELKLLEQAGEIANLRVHPRWRLNCESFYSGLPTEVCRYEADFSYLDNRTGEGVVEDVKGVRTPMYRLKRKWLKVEYGIDIVEIDA